MTDARRTMDHDEFLEQMDALLDGEVGPRQADRLRLHLEGCARCAVEWERARAMSARMRSLPREPMPEDLKRRIVAAARPRPRATGPWLIASAASAALLIVLSVVLFRTELPPSSSQQTQEDREVSSPMKKEGGARPLGRVTAQRPDEGRQDEEKSAPAAEDRAEPLAERQAEPSEPETAREPLSETDAAPPPPSGRWSPEPEKPEAAPSRDAVGSEQTADRADEAPAAASAPAPAAGEAAGGFVATEGKAPSSRAGHTSRWRTRVLTDADGKLSLAPLEPVVPELARRSRNVESSGQLTFLAETGPEGVITRADPVGPVGVPDATLAAIRRLLESSRVPGPPDAGTSVVILVTPPETR